MQNKGMCTTASAEAVRKVSKGVERKEKPKGKKGSSKIADYLRSMAK